MQGTETHIETSAYMAVTTVMPLCEEAVATARELTLALTRARYSVHFDPRVMPIGDKLHDIFQVRGADAVVCIGQQDLNAGTASFRRRNETGYDTVPLAEIPGLILEETADADGNAETALSLPPFSRAAQAPAEAPVPEPRAERGEDPMRPLAEMEFLKPAAERAEPEQEPEPRGGESWRTALTAQEVMETAHRLHAGEPEPEPEAPRVRSWPLGDDSWMDEAPTATLAKMDKAAESGVIPKGLPIPLAFGDRVFLTAVAAALARRVNNADLSKALREGRTHFAGRRIAYAHAGLEKVRVACADPAASGAMDAEPPEGDPPGLMKGVADSPLARRKMRAALAEWTFPPKMQLAVAIDGTAHSDYHVASRACGVKPSAIRHAIHRGKQEIEGKSLSLVSDILESVRLGLTREEHDARMESGEPPKRKVAAAMAVMKGDPAIPLVWNDGDGNRVTPPEKFEEMKAEGRLFPGAIIPVRVGGKLCSGKVAAAQELGVASSSFARAMEDGRTEIEGVSIRYDDPDLEALRQKEARRDPAWSGKGVSAPVEAEPAPAPAASEPPAEAPRAPEAKGGALLALLFLRDDGSVEVRGALTEEQRMKAAEALFAQ